MSQLKKYCAFLLVIVIMLSAICVPAWAKTAEQNLDVSANLELVSANYMAPTSTASDALKSIFGSISFDFKVFDNNTCTATGIIINDTSELDFDVSGNLVFVDNNNLVFSTMQGLADGNVMTMVLAQDYTANKQHVSISIGRLTGTDVPLQLEFGELTDSFSNYYATCAANTKSESSTEESTESIASPRIASDNISFINDDPAYLPNGNKCLVLSTYFPTTSVRNTNITVASKLTTDSTAILNYLKTIDSTAKSLKIEKATINTGSSNSGFRNIDQAPDEVTNTVTVWIPYLTSIDELSVSVKTLEYIVDSTSFTRSPSSNPTWVEHTFDMGMFIYPDWPKIDWGNKTPKQAPSGLAVNNVFTYVGSVGSAGQKVYVETSSTMTVGYYVELSNGRTQYHTFALDDLSVSGNIMVRDAS